MKWLAGLTLLVLLTAALKYLGPAPPRAFFVTGAFWARLVSSVLETSARARDLLFVGVYALPMAYFFSAPS